MDTISFSIAHKPGIIMQAQQLCHDTYLRMGYIDETASQDLLPVYDAASTYIVATNEQGLVVGTVRLGRHIPRNIFDIWKGKLLPGTAGLISRAMYRHSFTIGGLAVSKDYAGLKISWGLYHMAYEWALANHFLYGIISMDHRAFRALKMVGWHATQVGEPVWYLGSPTVPAIIPIMEQPANTVLKHKPHFRYYTA